MNNKITALPLPTTASINPTWDAQWALVPQEWQTPMYWLKQEPYQSAFATESAKKYNRRPYDYRTGYQRADREIAWFIYTVWKEGTYKVPASILRWYSKAAQSLIAQVEENTLKDEYTLNSIEPYIFVREIVRLFYTKKQHYPAPGTLRNIESLVENLNRHLSVRCQNIPWYQHDEWNLLLDPRIPRRENEPHSARSVTLSHIQQSWLKEAVRYWFSQACTYGFYTWTSLGTHVTNINYFSRFLNTIDHNPVTLAETLGGIRQNTTALIDYLKHPVEGCHAKALSENTVHAVCSTVQRLYEFCYENKELVSEFTGETTWLELTPDHTRLFPSYSRKKRSKEHPVTFFTPEELSTMIEYLEVLKTPTDQHTTIELPGEKPKRFQGIGDDQAARIWLLQALTGRRASEVLMMDYQPLEMLNMDPEKIQEDSLIARLTYQQTKVQGVDSTILVDTAVVNIIKEQQAYVEEKYPGIDHRYLFPNLRNNHRGNRPRSYQSYGDVLQRLDKAVKLTNSAGEQLRFTQTHRLRHTRATELLNNGVPVHVVQRYLGHRSPEMTMRYAETLAATAEAEFLRYKKVGSDGRDLGLSPKDLLEISQLDHRADRILPNGYCMLPPTQSCDKGNACLPCGAFATDQSYLQDHRQQLAQIDALIAKRKEQYKKRRNEEMPETNVWLEGRLREKASLEAIIAKLEDEQAQNKAVSGAGTHGRVQLTLISNPRPIGNSPIIKPNIRTQR